MFMSGSVSYLDLVVIPITIISFSIGLGRLFSHSLDYISTHIDKNKSEIIYNDFPNKIVLYLITGISFSPILLLLISSIKIPINEAYINRIVFLIIISNIYLCRKYYPALNINTIRTRFLVNMKDIRNHISFISFILMGSFIMWFHLSNSLGLYVHPGGDPKNWAYLANSIIEAQKYVGAIGRIASPYIKTPDLHSLFPGLQSLIVFLKAITGLEVGKLTLLITITLNSLGWIPAYYLGKKMGKGSKNQGYVFALMHSIFSYSTGFFSWGGNGEQTTYFFIPSILLMFLSLMEQDASSIRDNIPHYILTALTLFGGTLYYGYTLIYALTGIIPMYLVIKKTNIHLKKMLIPISFVFILLLLYVGFMYPFFINNPVISQKYIAPKIEGKVVIRKGLGIQDAALDLWQYLNTFHGKGTSILLILSFLSIFIPDQKSNFFFAIIWALLLFLIGENSPNGLFFIKYPYYYIFYPWRFSMAMAFPFAILSSISIMNVVNLKNRLKISINELNLQNINIIIHVPQKRRTILLLIIIILSTFFATPQLTGQITDKYDYLKYSRRSSPVTDADYDAFKWIKENTSNESIFLISDADAGAYIPLYSNRTVFPGLYVYVHTNISTAVDYFNLTSSLVTNTEYRNTLELLNKYNVTHIYTGNKISVSYATYFHPKYLELNPWITLLYKNENAHVWTVSNNSLSYQEVSIIDFSTIDNWDIRSVTFSSNGTVAKYSTNQLAGSWSRIDISNWTFDSSVEDTYMDIRILTQNTSSITLYIMGTNETIISKNINTNNQWKTITIPLESIFKGQQITHIRFATYAKNNHKYEVYFDHLSIYKLAEGE